MDVESTLATIAVLSAVVAMPCVALVRADVRIRASAWRPSERLAETIGDAVMPATLLGSVVTVLGVLATFELLLPG